VESFTIGDIITVEYLFSDGKTSKKRPALVIQKTPEDELLVCMVSATPRTDIPTFPIVGTDFQYSNLSKVSFVRPRAVLVVNKKNCKIIGRLSNKFVIKIKEHIADWVRSV
jgi:hypothetical protein